MKIILIKYIINIVSNLQIKNIDCYSIFLPRVLLLSLLLQSSINRSAWLSSKIVSLENDKLPSNPQQNEDADVAVIYCSADRSSLANHGYVV